MYVEATSLCSDGLMGLGHGLAWSLGGYLEICVDSEFVGPNGSSSGNEKVDRVAALGLGREFIDHVFGVMFEVREQLTR
jgi:hypothetical protein